MREVGNSQILITPAGFLALLCFLLFKLDILSGVNRNEVLTREKIINFNSSPENVYKQHAPRKN